MQLSERSDQNNCHYSLSIPGRIRVRIEKLRGDNALCCKLINYLCETSGIIIVTTNHYTAKILIIYDANKTCTHEIENAINTFINSQTLKAPKVSNVIKVNFKERQVLNASKFIQSINVISNEYHDFNIQSYEEMFFGKTNSTLWHTMNTKEMEQKLETDTKVGLMNDVANRRLEKIGLNQISKYDKKSFLEILLNHSNNFIVRLLLATSSISLLLGQVFEAFAVGTVLLVETLLGSWQEYSSVSSLESLKKISSPAATIIRNGAKIEIQAQKLVPGDILCLEAGNIVPADARIIENNGLEVIESSLSGESFPVCKNSNTIAKSDTTVMELTNMVFSGTSVVKGNAKSIVVQTGMSTQMGSICGMLRNNVTEKTPLQKDMDRLSKLITWGCVGVFGLVTLAGLVGGHSLMQMLYTGISVAIGAVPEGLSTILGLSLAISAQRMAKKNALVKSLPAIESLSCTKVICTDKTGTLTKNEMTVKNIYSFDKMLYVTGEGYNSNGSLFLNGESIDIEEHHDVITLLTAATLCNNAEIIPVCNADVKNKQYTIKGDPNEAALLIALEKSGLHVDEFKCYKREREIPFDSESKRMTAICSNSENQSFVFLKGALDSVLYKCTRIKISGDLVELTQEHCSQILQAHAELSNRAQRVLTFAYKSINENNLDVNSEDHEENLIFLGLIGTIDPPREEVKQAIKTCHEAGIKVVMITGDHKNTATAIAKSVNLLTDKGLIICGDEMDNISEQKLLEIIDNVQVFARTCPKQKLRIVKAFRSKGYIVAMTGDGVNDCLALKEADIGICMGKTGTDVAKDVSSIILMDDNFSTLVKVVEEGKTVNKNIKKFMRYVLTGNVAQILSILIASFTGMPIPLLPGQILMLNLVTEGLPALALGMDTPEPEIMQEPQRNPNQTIFDHQMRKDILSRGVLTGLITLGVFAGTLLLTKNLIKARTMCFANIVTSQMFHAFECSSSGLQKNKYILPAIVISLGVSILSIYLPFGASIFGMSALNVLEWMVVFGSTLLLSTLAKFINRISFVRA